MTRRRGVLNRNFTNGLQMFQRLQQTEFPPIFRCPKSNVLTMKKVITLSMALVMVFISCSKDDDEVPPSADPRSARMQAIADSMRLQIDSLVGLPIPGMHFYVQSPQGSYFISSAPIPSRRITSAHWFRFASLTKLFTASAVLNMQEEGWLDIDDTITSTVPGFGTTYVPSTPEWDIPYKNQITIRQLLSHTAGVFDCDNDTVPALGMKLTDYLLQSNPDHPFTTEDFTSTNATYNLSYFQPGTGYKYSNVGYSILGNIIARVYSANSIFPKTYTNYLEEVMITSVPSTVGSIRFPDNSTDKFIPSPGSNGMTYTGGTDTLSITAYNPSILIAQGNGQGTLKAVHDWVRKTLKAQGALTTQTIQLMNTPFVPDYSGEQYTFGYQDFGSIGRGHSGARAGNLCIAAYNPANDVSVLGYLPFWDIRDDINTVINNNLIPLYITMDLLAQEAQ